MKNRLGDFDWAHQMTRDAVDKMAAERRNRKRRLEAMGTAIQWMVVTVVFGISTVILWGCLAIIIKLFRWAFL